MTFRFRTLSILAAALLAFAALQPAWAQSQDARGNIVGRVTDPSGAVIPSASIKATNPATGVNVGARGSTA